jgi:Cu/Ag efflux protein CusF
MKIINATILCVVVFLAVGITASAQEEIKVRGTVIKIDATSQSVTIKPLQTPEVTVVINDAKQLSKVKEGETAEVRYVVKNGVNTGVRLRKLVEGCQ